MKKVFNDRWIGAVTSWKRSTNAKAEMTAEGKKPIPPAQQVRQRLLEFRTGWRFYPSSRTTHWSSSTHWQQSRDWKSNRSWDSWQTSSWTEQYFSLFRDVISLAGNSISWQSTGCADRHTYRAPHFLMHSSCTVVS